jgi:hypothetical protein
MNPMKSIPYLESSKLTWRVSTGRDVVTDTSFNQARIVPAPEPSRPDLHNMVLSVNCAAGEDVEWQWTETAKGRFVSGYRIVRRENPRSG